MFQFPGFAPAGTFADRCRTLVRQGCPIRKSRDQRSLAPPPSLSQLATSFLASDSLGIPRAPLFRFLALSVAADRSPLQRAHRLSLPDRLTSVGSFYRITRPDAIDKSRHLVILFFRPCQRTRSWTTSEEDTSDAPGSPGQT